MQELKTEALIENFEKVSSFADDILKACPEEVKLAAGVAVEEIFINIVSYAYAPGTGSVTIQAQADKDRITFVVTDSGKPFNPLEYPEPDISLPAEKRQTGGLGIYMAKKIMDSVSYEYADGKNKLTLIKCF